MNWSSVNENNRSPLLWFFRSRFCRSWQNLTLNISVHPWCQVKRRVESTQRSCSTGNTSAPRRDRRTGQFCRKDLWPFGNLSLVVRFVFFAARGLSGSDSGVESWVERHTKWKWMKRACACQETWMRSSRLNVLCLHNTNVRLIHDSNLFNSGCSALSWRVNTSNL